MSTLRLSELDQQDMLRPFTACALCPRRCGVNRLAGERGYCGQTARLRAARAALHMWEEPCISGAVGSGTVFFSGCNLRCVYCQNHDIAVGGTGREISVERLTEICLELQQKGAANINLVTPTHYIPLVGSALRLARSGGLSIPVVYNCGGYEEPEALKMLDGLVDIYLPDLKYSSSELSARYSHAADYFEKARLALEEMFRQCGKPEFALPGAAAYSPDTAVCSSDAAVCSPDAAVCSPDTAVCSSDAAVCSSDAAVCSTDAAVCSLNAAACSSNAAACSPGADACSPDAVYPPDTPMLRRGMIVRHLVLPGQVGDSKRVLHYLHDTYGDDIYVSVMCQYTPLPHVADHPELNRRVTPEEYQRVVDYCLRLGMENVYIQEGDTAQESFIPPFDLSGL